MQQQFPGSALNLELVGSLQDPEQLDVFDVTTYPLIISQFGMVFVSPPASTATICSMAATEFNKIFILNKTKKISFYLRAKP